MAIDKSPEQVIYDAVFRVSAQLGYDTFTYLPSERVKYPFVFIGEVFTEDRHNKTGVFGDVMVSVHVFHSYKKRAEVTEMLNQIKYRFYEMKKAENLYLRLRNGNIELMIDDTEAPNVLLHGLMDLNFTFNY